MAIRTGREAMIMATATPTPTRIQEVTFMERSTPTMDMRMQRRCALTCFIHCHSAPAFQGGAYIHTCVSRGLSAEEARE